MSKIGISNFHYAVQTAEETPTSDATYGTTKAVPGLVSVDITTDTQMQTLYADNIAYETASSAPTISVSIELADLPLDVQADLLGHTYDTTNKTLVKKGSDVNPYCAFLFEFLMGNGKTQCVKLYKGRVSEPNMAGNSKQSDVEFGTNSITAEFVGLKGKDGNTGKWQYLQEFEAGASTAGFYTAPIVSADAG